MKRAAVRTTQFPTFATKLSRRWRQSRIGRRTQSPRALRFEPLEDRRLMAGDFDRLIVEQEGNVLSIIGTEADDDVEIKAQVNGVVVVTAPREEAEAVFFGVSEIRIDTMGGNDRIHVRFDDISERTRVTDGPSVPMKASVDSGLGDDFVRVALYENCPRCFNPQPDPPGSLPAYEFSIQDDGGNNMYDVLIGQQMGIRRDNGGINGASEKLRIDTSIAFNFDLTVPPINGHPQVHAVNLRTSAVEIGPRGALAFNVHGADVVQSNLVESVIDGQLALNVMADSRGSETSIIVVDGKVGHQGSLDASIRPLPALIGDNEIIDSTMRVAVELDRVDIKGLANISLATGGGADEVGIILQNVHTSGQLAVSAATGGGADEVGIILQNSAVTSANSLRQSVDTGEGDDVVRYEADGARLEGGLVSFTARTDGGNDRVEIRQERLDLRYGSRYVVQLETEAGRDAVQTLLGASTLASGSTMEVRIDTGEENDAAFTAIRENRIVEGSTLRTAVFSGSGDDLGPYNIQGNRVASGGTLDVLLDYGNGDDTSGPPFTVDSTTQSPGNLNATNLIGGNDAKGGSKIHITIQTGNSDDSLTTVISDNSSREGSTVNIDIRTNSGDDRLDIREEENRRDSSSVFRVDVDPGAGDNRVRHTTEPRGEEKFFVVDQKADHMFLYDTGFDFLNAGLLAIPNHDPKGVAATPDSSRLFVVDQRGTVFVYDSAVHLVGIWTASGVTDAEGIATDGIDVWIVDNASDRVFRYAGGAGLLAGTHAAASSFALVGSNNQPRGLTTDGQKLWVVNDATTDRVFVYGTNGTSLGSWSIDKRNARPTGITIDPNDLRHVWTVDNGRRQVFQYNNAAGRVSGSQNAGVVYDLHAGNANPQGIADPSGLSEIELRDPRDVDGDGVISPRDVLLVINYLNSGRKGEVDSAALLSLDVSRDGFVTSLDALLIFNYLNGPQAEGEAAAAADNFQTAADAYFHGYDAAGEGDAAASLLGLLLGDDASPRKRRM